ncbi:hypothetical protein Tco_0688216 [Tanacetum coccineum]
MGNVLRLLYSECCSKPNTNDGGGGAWVNQQQPHGYYDHGGGGGAWVNQQQSHGYDHGAWVNQQQPHGYDHGGGGGAWVNQQQSHGYDHGGAMPSAGVSAIARDIHHFEKTSEVPEGLSKHVVSSKNAQSNWYSKLSETWAQAKPPPKSPEEVSRLVVDTLKRHKKADVEGLLAFYGLPLSQSTVETSAGTGHSQPAQTSTGTSHTQHIPGLKFELYTLPACVPQDVQAAAVERAKARAQRNYTKADALHKQITDAGYRMLNIQNEEILARKYRIRLRVGKFEDPLHSIPMPFTRFRHVTASILQACAMSDLVQIITNIKLPTADAYGTRDISILSFSLLGLILEDNLTSVGNGVDIGLQSCILKPLQIFFTLTFCESQNFPN